MFSVQTKPSFREVNFSKARNHKNILILYQYGNGKFEFGDGYDRHFVHVFYRWGAIMRVMSDKMKILFAYIKKKK